MTRFLLIRHASNDFLKQGRLAGRTPGVHLNAQGQREAEEMARRTAQLPLEAIYSSPLERAVDTANALAHCHQLNVQIVPGLIEGEAGEWTGRKIDELKDTDTWKQIQTKPVGVKLPGGESIDQVQARMVAALEEIRRKHPDGLVAVVSHADALKSVVAHYLNWDLDQFQRIAISPASVTIIDAHDQGAALICLNHNGALPSFEKPKPKDDAGANKSLQAEMQKERHMAEANIVHDLNPVSRLTVGALGEPGQRTFFIQGRQGHTLVSLVTEKEQMRALAQGVADLLTRLGDRVDAPIDVSDYELALEEPVEPLFRVGQLGLGYDQESDLLVVVAYELTAEDAASSDVVRFWATRDQMRALSRHIAQVASAGRPTCVLCGRPIDPAGHFCPRRNGHATYVELA